MVSIFFQINKYKKMKLQKKIVLILVMLLLIPNSMSYAYDLIAVDSLNVKEIGHKLELATIQVYYKNRKLVKKVKGAYFYKFMNKFIETENNYIISVVDENKKAFFFSKEDFDKKINIIPPFLIIKNKFIGKLGDTLKIQYETNKAFDFADLDVEFGLVIKERVHLQMKYSKNDSIKKYFKPITLIFPQDKTVTRWVENIEKIIIYEIKKPD